MANVMLFDEAYSFLRNTDWDFVDNHQDEISMLHPYPARFIESIPNKLITEIGLNTYEKVFDPFCGSGTTLLEAQKLGFESVGVDLNPIACLISKVKTQKALTDIITEGEALSHRAQIKYQKEVLSLPSIPNLDHWFKQDIQKAIFSLISEINVLSNECMQDALRFCLSSIIVRLSNQESDTRYAAVEKKSSAMDVYRNFEIAAKRLQSAQVFSKPNILGKIINKDILSINQDEIGNNVGLVITSPPYPNAYEYWLYHKYRMWWLGYDPIEVREHEIGARPHYQKKNGQTEENFYNQMASVFDLFSNVVVPNGHVCIVIGRSIIRGKEIDNAKLIRDIAEKRAFVTVADIERTIALTKKSFNLKYGKIKTENILIFRKVDRYDY